MKLMKTLTLAAALSVSVSTFSYAADAKVALSDLNWTGAKAIAHVIKAVIEGPLGSEAAIIEGLSDQSIIAAGMDKGDGSVDVYTDMWMPNQQALWDKFVVEAKTVGTNQPYLGTQSMYVPAYLADKIKSFDDLNDPEIAAMFDTNGNGKGEYWAGDASWKSTKIWQVKMKDYGLSELWEPNIISDATFKAQLKSAYGNQKPVLFYYWTPESIHAQYDLSPLSEPAFTEGCIDLNLDSENFVEDSKAGCQTPDANIYVSYSKSLEQRNPAAAKFLSQVKFDPATVNNWILKINEEEMDPQDVAEEWIAANSDIVDAWIK